jgi:hypothetical protein
VAKARPGIRFNEHIEGDGPTVFAHACKMGLEGIVSKRIKIKSRIAELGASTLPGSPADFGKLIADETEKWGKVVRTANIKPE